MTNLLLFRVQASGRDYRLSQRQSAVVGRDPAMNQDGESFSLDALDRRRLQQAVLKTSTAQRHDVDAALLARASEAIRAATSAIVS